MASASGKALYSCFLCRNKHTRFKLTIAANPASLKEQKEWPDNVAVFRTDGTTEVLSSGGANEALYVAVESLSLTEADGGSKRGSSGPGSGSSSGSTPGDPGIEHAHRGSKRRSSEPARGMLNMKVCRDCELQWRMENKHTHPDGPERATMPRVTRDHKNNAKGQQWVARGQHYQKATEICELVKDM